MCKDSGERSTPTTFAPSRAQEIVSVPMWHCRWSMSIPVTSPNARRSYSTTLLIASLFRI